MLYNKYCIINRNTTKVICLLPFFHWQFCIASYNPHDMARYKSYYSRRILVSSAHNHNGIQNYRQVCYSKRQDLKKNYKFSFCVQVYIHLIQKLPVMYIDNNRLFITRAADKCICQDTSYGQETHNHIPSGHIAGTGLIV